MATNGNWALEAEDLRTAGFSDDEILAEGGRIRAEMRGAGFTDSELNNYFAPKPVDLSAAEAAIQNNLDFRPGSMGMLPAPDSPESGNSAISGAASPKVSEGFLGALEAGWKASSLSTIIRAYRGENVSPDTVLPEDAPLFYSIASQVGTLAGDLPAMIAGSVVGAPIGAIAGSAAPIVGNVTGGVIGMGAGGAMAPTLIRETLMESYGKGEVQNFRDFWGRFSAVTLKTLKSGVVGGVTMGVGNRIGGAIAAPILSRTAQATSEVATMTTLGAALEGEMPKAEDFVTGGIIVGGLTGSTLVATKLRNIYGKAGVKPAEVVREAQVDPMLKQELLMRETQLPSAYEAASRAQGVLRPETLEFFPVGDATKSSPLLQNGGANLRIEIPKVEPQKTSPVTGTDPTPQSKILERVAASDQVGKKSGTSFDQFYTDYVDDLHPIKQMVDALRKENFIPVKDDPYKLMRMTRGSYGRGDAFIKYGPSDFNTLKTTGKSLESILDPVKTDLDGFRAFIVSRRAIDLETRGIKTGVPIEEAKAVVTQGSARYEKVANELVGFRNSTLQYLKDSGVIGQEAYKAMLDANKNHVPFYRLTDEQPGGIKNASESRNPVKAIEGSERLIIDPVESIIRDTFTFTEIAEKNRAVTKLVELSEKNSSGSDLVKRVKNPVNEIELKPEEISRFLDENGIEADASSFSVFRASSSELAKDQIAVYRNGKREVYQVPEAVADSIKRTDTESANLLLKIATLPAKGLRVGMVLDPAFQLRNLSRDTLAAFVYSKNLITPWWQTISGLKEVIKKGDSFQEWLRAGGSNSASLQLDREFIQKNIFELSQQTGLMDKTWNVLKSPIELVKTAGEILENSNRLARFMKDRAKGADPFESAFNSREGTLDFARIGAKMRGVNSLVAFLNVHVQGWDRLARAMKEDPLGTNARLAAAITVPSLYLWIANKDDPRYADIPTWQKRAFFIIMTDDWKKADTREAGMTGSAYKRQLADGSWEVNHGIVYRYPKPPEFGLLYGTLPEMVLDEWFKDKPADFGDFAKEVIGTLSPNLMPNAAAPIIEQQMGKSFFTGRNIIPGHLEGIAPEYQYTEYTTDTAKMLGRMVAYVPGAKDSSFASPPIIENYFRSWGGATGTYFLQLVDQALHTFGLSSNDAKPASTLNDIPFVKSFVIRFPQSSPQSIQDFYDNAERSSRQIQTLRHLAKQGNAIDYERESELSKMTLDLSAMKSAISKQSAAIHNIYRLPISPTDKRQLIDGIYYQMSEIAKMGNKMVKNFEKSKEGAKRNVNETRRE